MANLSGEMSNQKGINLWQVLNYLFNKNKKKLASILKFKRIKKKAREKPGRLVPDARRSFVPPRLIFRFDFAHEFIKNEE